MKVHVRRTNEGQSECWSVILVNERDQELSAHQYFWRIEHNSSRWKVIQMAVIDAQEWADFFGVTPEPFYDGDRLIEPMHTLDTYVDDATRIARHKARTA